MRQERGVITIFISIVILLLITVLLVSAYQLSTTNLKAVGNAQVREEATASANQVIEQTIDSDFISLTGPVIGTLVDINGDGVTDYSVDLAQPICIRVTRAAASTVSSVTLPGMTVSSAWNSIWELAATATETTTGVSVQVVQGIRVLLSDAEKNSLCN